MTIARLGPKYDSLRNSGMPILPFVYIGFIKDNNDAQRMGRLSVWIPEMGGNPADRSSWIIASYASPFAGATDITQINGYTTNSTVAQQSYGLWLVPPDLNNEVCVFFAAGDISRAYWFGCCFQQNMNHMVPGIATDVTTDPSPPITIEPTIEYNKSDPKNNVYAPRRPAFQPLTDGLDTEGLNTDLERGMSSTSARREVPSEVFGLLSPRGNSLHIDDNPANEFIRMRTRSGAQVLIHETTGYVYINSKNGNAWIEISDAGIDVYSSNSVSIRAQGDLNVRADRNIFFDADQNISLRASNDITMQAGRDMQIKVGRDILASGGHDCNIGIANNMIVSVGNPNASGGSLQISIAKDMALKTGGGINLQSTTDTQINSKQNLLLMSGKNTSLKATAAQYRDGSSINDNTGQSVTLGDFMPTATTAPIVPAGGDQLDTTPKLVNNKWLWTSAGGKINTIDSRMPTHEPWKNHPNSNVPPPPQEDVPINYQPTYGQGGSSNAGTSGSAGTGNGDAVAGTAMNDSGCSFGAANTKPCSTEVYNAIMAAASKTGANPATMLAFADIESSFQPGAGAKTSSATGLYQFTNGTWNSMVSKYGAQYNVAPDSINDAVCNSLMGGQFLQDNAAILKAKGVANPTPGQLYIMHFMGSGGGPALISAAQSNPSGDASLLFPGAAGANPSIFQGQTVGAVYTKLTSMADNKANAYANQHGLDAPCIRSEGTPSGALPNATTPSGTNPQLPSDFEQYKGRVIGNGECVTLVQQIGGLPNTHQWLPGNKPNADTPMGQPIASFQNGKYQGHAGFFDGMLPDGSGFQMVDQYNNPKSTPVGVRTYHYSASGIQNAGIYYVINLPTVRST